MKKLVLASVVALAAAGCGSSGGSAATASQGDAFCKLAQTAKDDNDALSNVDFTDPAKVKLQLSAAIDSLTAMAAKAPKDISATVKSLLDDETKLETLLKANDFDIVKMSATDEGKALIDEADKSTTGEELDKYLSDKCGITIDTSEDTTVPSDTTPVDTTATNDSTGVSVDVGECAAAINKFLDFYEIGTGAKLTAEQRSCIVDSLHGKVTGEDLNKVISGGDASTELEQALGLAFIGCNVTVQG